MVWPTVADDTDTKVFATLVWFKRGITPLAVYSLTAQNTDR